MKRILSQSFLASDESDRYPRRGSARRYDVMSRLPGVTSAQWQLVAQAAIAPSATVLEIGTGTGNVALLVKRAVPAATVIGLDPNAESLAAAAFKADRAGVELRLDLGSADHLPYEDASIDRVLSSFMFHHLVGEVRLAALHEVRRVLRPGGSFHVLDLATGKPAPAGWLLARKLISWAPGKKQHGHGHGHTPELADPDADVLGLMAEAGLLHAAELGRGTSALGEHAYYRADV